MVQDPSESIDQFAFKYKNVLHKLDKLGKISEKLVPLRYLAVHFKVATTHCSAHRSADGSDYSFR